MQSIKVALVWLSMLLMQSWWLQIRIVGLHCRVSRGANWPQGGRCPVWLHGRLWPWILILNFVDILRRWRKYYFEILMTYWWVGGQTLGVSSCSKKVCAWLKIKISPAEEVMGSLIHASVNSTYTFNTSSMYPQEVFTQARSCVFWKFYRPPPRLPCLMWKGVWN